MIRNPIPIILIRRRARLHIINQQRGTIERGADASCQGAHFCRVGGADGEGTRGAGEDVAGCGTGKGADAGEGEEGVGVDAAGDGRPLGLGVDGKGLGGVTGPYGGDVGFVVIGEEGGIEDYAVVWG